jgi:hypothetical protein
MTMKHRPEANDNEQLELALYRQHEAEAARQNAEFYNLGWVQTDFDVCSKTSKGYLVSEVDPDTVEVTHNWIAFAELERRREKLRALAESYLYGDAAT